MIDGNLARGLPMAMKMEELRLDMLWRYYQRGYYCLIRSGLYFRQILRPALSHAYFQRAMPLLITYARANHGHEDLPPDFSNQMEACPLTPRDLLHLDYAICLGYAETQGADPRLATAMVLEWPGLGGTHGTFVAADALMTSESEAFLSDFEDTDSGDVPEEDEDSKPPFDL